MYYRPYRRTNLLYLTRSMILPSVDPARYGVSRAKDLGPGNVQLQANQMCRLFRNFFEDLSLKDQNLKM